MKRSSHTKLYISGDTYKTIRTVNRVSRIKDHKMQSVVTVATGALQSASLLGIGPALTFAPVLIAAIAIFHFELLNPANHPRVERQLRQEYDFVVVGGGSAGAVVVNRLTENPKWSVLLLEAGIHENEISDVPILSLYLHKSKMDWGYKTEPQRTACQAMVDGRCYWTRGKVSWCFFYLSFGEVRSCGRIILLTRARACVCEGEKRERGGDERLFYPHHIFCHTCLDYAFLCLLVGSKFGGF